VEVTSLTPGGRQLIQAYRQGGFTVAGIRYEGSLLVMPERTVAWPVGTLDAVTLESVAPITASEGDVELLILGCGAAFAPAPPALCDGLRSFGVVVEAMTTPAACRTYNVLLAEDRRVATALIAL